MPPPAPTPEPASARSSPAITIKSVDLPDPDGPTRPTASPRPIFSVMSLRMCTRAAPAPSERLTPDSVTAGRTAGAEAGLIEVSFMRLLQFHRGAAGRWRRGLVGAYSCRRAGTTG